MKIKAHKSFKQWEEEQMRNPKFRKIANDLDLEFALIEAIIKQRAKHKMTQKQLAKKVGTKQSAISRFESGNYNPTLAFFRKVARALDMKLTATAI